ncbi:MAG: hypothetical protein N3A65_03110 [candidate division WOR-3 bacterium]|nr:hypothetical protein [candidate division WOR-3 bacterium]
MSSLKYFDCLVYKILFLIFSLITIGVSQKQDSLSDTIKSRLDVHPEVKSAIKYPGDKWFAQDKFLHFYFCASIVGLSYHTLANRLNHDENQSKIFSISFTAFVGLGKEIYDKKKKGFFSWKDLCWDGAGLVMGYFAFVHKY